MSLKKIISSALLTTLVSTSVHAAVLANPDFDADSYIEFGTNNAFDPVLTIGASQRPGSGHFNFGVVTFDTSSMSAAGDKFLSLSAVEYISTSPNPSGGRPITTTSTTGAAVVHVVALGDNYNNYLSAADKVAWYDANVQNAGVTVLGTMNFINESTGNIDVTSAVNGWISNAASNNGFAIFSTSGNVELASVTNTNAALRPALLDAVPEPSSILLLGLASCLSLTLRKR